MTDPQATAQPTRVTTGGLSWTCPWCKQRFPDSATSHTCEHFNPKPDRYEEGRQQGLREAAEIARARAVSLRSRSILAGDAACGAIDVAQAIEAKAGENP